MDLYRGVQRLRFIFNKMEPLKNGCNMEVEETYIKYVFRFFEPFCMRLALELAKVHISAKNHFFVKIRYGYHTTQNSMLSLNPLKKCKKLTKKVLGRKLLHTVSKSRIWCSFRIQWKVAEKWGFLLLLLCAKVFDL